MIDRLIPHIRKNGVLATVVGEGDDHRIPAAVASRARCVAVVPSLLMALWHLNRFPFYGTTLLISVGVALETMRQIDSQLMMRNYEGFLK